MTERRGGSGVKPAGEKKAPAKRSPSFKQPTELDALTAALAVSQRLDLDGQLHAFLDVARAWTEASDGLTFGPDAEGAAFAPLAGTLAAGDARQESFRTAVLARAGEGFRREPPLGRGWRARDRGAFARGERSGGRRRRRPRARAETPRSR
jgi:hypothetical protein